MAKILIHLKCLTTFIGQIEYFICFDKGLIAYFDLKSKHKQYCICSICTRSKLWYFIRIVIHFYRWYLKPQNILRRRPPPPPPSAVSLSVAVSEHGFGQMLHALCALAYRRGRPWWHLPTAPPPTRLHDLPPPLQPTCPQCPAAGGSENTHCQVAVCVRVIGGGGGVVLEEAALSDRLIGRLIRQWRERGKVPQVGQACVCLLLLSSLTNL